MWFLSAGMIINTKIIVSLKSFYTNNLTPHQRNNNNNKTASSEANLKNNHSYRTYNAVWEVRATFHKYDMYSFSMSSKSIKTTAAGCIKSRNLHVRSNCRFRGVQSNIHLHHFLKKKTVKNLVHGYVDAS